MAKKKKNLWLLLGLTALLAVCIVLYIFIPQGEKSDSEEDAEETKEEITVDTIDAEKITSLEVTGGEKGAWKIVKEGGNWKFAENKKIPLDSEAVTGLFSCLNPVQAAMTLEKKEDSLKDYGLDNPSMTIQVATADGAEYQYKLGSAVPVKGGYYGLNASEDKIYCLSESLFTTFDIDSKTLIKKDELPEITADYMTYILVDNKKGTDFEAKVVGKNEQVDAYSNWNIIKPYGRPLATSAKTWPQTKGYFTSLAFGELIEYGSGKLQSYGLETPSARITVKYYEAKDGYTPEATATPAADGEETAAEIPEKYRVYKTLQLCVGNKTGESYYVCLKGSGNVYTMAASSVESMTKLDAYASMDHCVYSTLATDLKGYDVICGNTSWKVTRTPAEKEDSTSESDSASGGSITSENKNIWKVNGKEVPAEDEDAFLTPYSSLYLLEFTGKARASVKPAGSRPVLTIVYHEEGRDVTVKYLPYDGTNFYRVDKDGMNYFLVDKRSVDDAVKKFDILKKIGK